METAARKISRSIVIEIQGRNGPNLKREHGAPQYKLNSVYDLKGIRKPNQGGAQIAEQSLYTTIYCSCQCVIIDILCFSDRQKS